MKTFEASSLDSVVNMSRIIIIIITLGVVKKDRSVRFVTSHNF